MKKLLLGLAIAVVSLSGTNATVGAADSCSISNTGPGSTNTCVVKEDFECKVETDNKFTVVNKNTQDATSGTATVTDNTTGGSATSGSATNSNGTVINVEIVNDGCIVTAVTQPAPTGGSGSVAPASQPAPAGGMGAVTPVAAPEKVAPTVLPNTSAGSAAGVIAALIATLGLAVVGSRFAVIAYSNLKS